MVKKLSNHLIGLYDKDVMDLIKIRKQLSKLVDEITNLDLSIYTETSSKAIIAPLSCNCKNASVIVLIYSLIPIAEIPDCNAFLAGST